MKGFIVIPNEAEGPCVLPRSSDAGANNGIYGTAEADALGAICAMVRSWSLSADKWFACCATLS